MANITNTAKQPLGLPSGIVIPPGETVPVPSWATDSQNAVVRAWVRNRILVPSGTTGAAATTASGSQKGPNDPPADDKDEKDVLIEALAEYGITKTRRSSVESLQAALDEAKAEAGE